MGYSLGIILLILSSVVVPLRAFGEDAVAALTLRECALIALRNNKLVSVANLNTAIADDRLALARTAFMPKVFAEATYNKKDEAPGANTSFGSFSSGPREFGETRFTLTQPVYEFGRVTSRYAEAKAVREASVHSTQRTKQDLVFEVTKAYFDILRAQKRLDVTLQARDLIEAQLKVSQDFFDAGLVAKDDVLNAEVRLAQADQDITSASNDLSIARAALNTILDFEIDREVSPVDILNYEPVTIELEHCIETAMTAHPQLAQRAAELKAAQMNVRATKRLRAPVIFLEGTYYYQDNDTLMNKDEVNGALKLQWNIFDSGMTSAQVAAAAHAQQQVEESQSLLKDRITFEVKQAYLRMRDAETRLGVTGKAIEQAEENLRITQDKYGESLATATDVLDAQTLLVRARNNHFDALYGYNVGFAGLEYAVGGPLRTGSVMETIEEERVTS